MRTALTARSLFGFRSWTALALLTLTAFFAAACGDDDDDTNDAQPTNPGAVGTASTAAELVPDLTSLGFREAAEQLPSLETANSKVVLFEDPSGPVPSLRLEIAVATTIEAAQDQFNALSQALRNPPPGLFGPDAKQTDGTAVYQADQSRSYQTDKPDNEGTLVFSDVHRMGRALVIMYTIGPAGPDTENVRKQVAETMAARAPR